MRGMEAEYELIATVHYQKWHKALRDKTARALIGNRLARLVVGHFGDCKSVGEGVYELRFFYGPGYRIYYAIEGEYLIVLLAGGDKSSQARDIEKAKDIWQTWQEG